jgi:hypothetical protein
MQLENLTISTGLYLPGKQEKATQTVLEQAEVLSEIWAMA